MPVAWLRSSDLFAEQRLDGLLDAPRQGAPLTIDDAKVDAVITRTLELVSKNATHWCARSMAREMIMSQTEVIRIWRAFDLQPHRQETFKPSTDPLFVEKMRDIVISLFQRICQAVSIAVAKLALNAFVCIK